MRKSKVGQTFLSGVLCLAGLAVLATGCQPMNTDPNPGQLDPALPYYRIVTNDDDLAEALRFDKPIVVRDENGFVSKVEVTVRAAAIERLRVDYRPIFKDGAGVVLQPESSWRTKILEKRVPERIVMLPVGKNAMDYEIQFRWSR